MLFDKSQKDENHDDTKPPHLGLAASFQQQPSTSSKKSGHYSSDMDLEQFASIMNNTEFDFDFNETTEHNEKSFDPLKFLLKEINGGATTELSFNQAELEPVQVSCQQAFCFLSVYLSLHPQTRRPLNNISLNWRCPPPLQRLRLITPSQLWSQSKQRGLKNQIVQVEYLLSNPPPPQQTNQ